MDSSVDDCYDFLQNEDNLLSKQKVTNKKMDFETDSGICASEFRITDDEASSKNEVVFDRNLQTPVITIDNDAVVDQIEMAKIESFYERILTPEGNVKFKNYRILAPAPGPLRMYSPSGDIHTTPKKGKIVPKFDLFHDSLYPRDKLLALIDHRYFGSIELEAILKPSGISRNAMQILRISNKSNLDDRIDFLRKVMTPSPSSISMFSDESVFVERFLTPSPNSELYLPPKIFKSFSIDVEEKCPEPKKTILKQKSLQCDENNHFLHANLWDELRIAENPPNNFKERKMTEFEYSYFHRPTSSISRTSMRSQDRRKPRESKKSLIRNFIQRIMIDKSANRDKLAKLALAIEDDTEEENEILSAAQRVGNKLEEMLDETKELRSEIVEIHDDMKDDDEKVGALVLEAKTLASEIRSAKYLDDIISLLNGDLDAVSDHKCWPFAAYLDGKRRNPDMNLIV